MKILNTLKSLFIIAAILTYAQGAIAQSRYFDERYIYTQAQLNPQLINPGAFGHSGGQQVLLNYRSKWAGVDGAPRTVSLSYNGAVGNRLGLGVNLVSDRFGSLETTKIGFGMSYTIKSDDNQIGFGLTGEYIRHGLSGFGNADPNDPLIALGTTNAEFFDASFGMYGVYDKKFSYGISLPSIVSSRISESNVADPDRSLGLIVQLAYKLDLHPDITFTPGVIFKKLNLVPTHLDVNLNFGFLEDKLITGMSYTLGADKRLGFLIGTKLEKFVFYYSYNTTSSSIQDYNNGSNELTLGVNF